MTVESMLMKDGQSRLGAISGSSTQCIAIAATFTAEPVQEALEFWMEEIGQSGSIEFAPYNQVFQELLDPNSRLAKNRRGVNVVLVRLEDWQRFHKGVNGHGNPGSVLAQSTADLINAVQSAMVRFPVPLVVVFCPNSPAVLADLAVRTAYEEIEEQITSSLHQIPNLHLIRSSDFLKYPVDQAYDLERDRLGHIPYTPLFFVVLATILARRINAITSPPYKVIVLDCDNTIWKGVVGEEGVEGIAIPPAWGHVQRLMVELAGKGFLVCLCSKNDESDVFEVFDKRPDMILKRAHLVSWRINWRPKSENLKSLAQELNLGLDSFIFLDDNPLECAEVRSGCPEVLTLEFPREEVIVDFLGHVWAFDRLQVTSEDQQRTVMYKQEVERTRFQMQALSIQDFLEGLNLQVNLPEPSEAQIVRVAQLTQRTNQFNFTTVRRTEAEILRLPESGLECRIVEVSDRFGDYGLVGVMIFSAIREALEVDTFLLSCRVLSRGVEHRMLNKLGKIALDRGLSMVTANLITTRKNQPAADFLESVAASFRQEVAEGGRYSIPAAVAAGVVLSPVCDKPDTAAVLPSEVSARGQPHGLPRRLERIATELFSPERVFAALWERSSRRRSRPELDQPFVASRTKIEGVLAELWASLLRFESVGINDDFFELGGTSLLAVDLFVQIDRQLGQRLPLTTLIEAPTIEQLARLVGGDASRDSLVMIREGGERLPIFLVHDGDGETMLYRNLALSLKRGHAVYGLQPNARQNIPLAQTRISEMAAHHIEKLRSIQPHGPYLLGGMCAGGVIAYEIARQLQGQGEIVAMVALIDAADVAAPTKTWRFAQQRIQSFSTVFNQDASARFRSLFVMSKIALRKAKNLATYLIGQRVKNLRDGITMRLFRFCVDRGLKVPRALEKIPVRTVYLYAEKNYQPESPYHGELLLFRATCGEGADEPYIKRYSDPLLGWGSRTTGNVRVCDIPGGHSSMLQEPNVHVLATRMQAYLDQVLATEPLKPVGQLSPTQASY
jgi:FkbH-like protein